ncbi:MAG: DUF2093 domain-containing protein [Sphingomonadales bacterium]
MDIAGGPAKLKYLDGRFEWITQGSHVICAVTGERIALEDLRYWSVELQEPYASAEASYSRFASLST